MPTNSLGLSRHIPEAVKREVRQRCGFGCIRCGACIYEYEHFDPDYSEAKEHSSQGITLLCPTCHALKTKGILTRDIVRELNANPATQQGAKPSITLPHFAGVPTVRLGGGFLIENTPIPIRIRDVPVLEFQAPEEGSSVTRVSALLSSADERNLLRIQNNEWIVESGIWDFEWVGQRISIRDAEGEALRLFVAPPGYIGVDRFRASVGDRQLLINEAEFRLGQKLIVGGMIKDCAVGVQIGMPDNSELIRSGGGMFLP